jgi:hypothetical protein
LELGKVGDGGERLVVEDRDEEKKDGNENEGGMI